MVFADLIFLFIFLPVNLLLYYQTDNRRFRNMILIAFSMFFYAWGEPIWVALLIFSATIDYIHGLIIERHRGQLQAKLAVVSSLVLNLGILAIFKYTPFLCENLNAIFGLNLPIPRIALPIGISFYTFQTISYTVDAYRGKVEIQHSFWDFLMYVSLYFQLVAGPIVRYADVSEEISNRKENIADISNGMTRFCIGLSKKVLVANTAGKIAAPYLAQDAALTVAGAWFGILLYALQIFYDFSGYSDMAIGLGQMFGFHFLENFNYPYIAKSATDFWRRWHMSLGSFFRDYLYIPLGGSRIHPYRNLLIVWFATGLWHGASWNFILWGLYFGFFIALEKLAKKALPQQVIAAIPAAVKHIYLLLLALFGWVLFCFTDLSRAVYVMRTMLGLSSVSLYDVGVAIDVSNNLFWLLAALLFCMPVWRVLYLQYERFCEQYCAGYDVVTPLLNVMILLFCTASLVGQSYNPFLYYRF